MAIVNLAFIFVSNRPLFEWSTVFTALRYVALLSCSTNKLSHQEGAR